MTDGCGRQGRAGRDLQYLAYAKAYSEAAERLGRCDAPFPAVQIPFFQLVAHAVELALKAAISFQGRGEEDLMWIGHDLDRCCRYLVSDGFETLGLTGIAFLVSHLDAPHSMQAFRYPQHFHWVMPRIDETLRSLSEVLRAVETYVTTQNR